jgi:ankyrin repeat protein
MKFIIFILLLSGCAVKPLTNQKVEKLPPQEVAKRGSESNIFQKAKLLIAADDLDGFTQLVKSVPNINARNEIGNTLLHIAVEAKNSKVVKEVLKKNPNLNTLNNFHYTPLMTAVVRGTRETVRALLQVGADPNITDAFDMNCLMRAAYNEDFPMVKLLIQFKVTPFSNKPGRQKASDLARWNDVKKPLLDYEATFGK